MGEVLTTAEQAVYESGCQELDAYERLEGNLERLHELHAQIAAAETEQQRLQAREAELNWEGGTTQRTAFRSQADAG